LSPAVSVAGGGQTDYLKAISAIPLLYEGKENDYLRGVALDGHKQAVVLAAQVSIFHFLKFLFAVKYDITRSRSTW
jgi:acetoacetate decarboxylase